ncbi:DMT family transporter [Terrihabitans rhizophilus]|uniref:DMT family transporter n=1 Tax=Terrihabitans rhizophilus TaxID=3092662 RepID=A0ABU4RKQ1_9HYPH|nr:DMT family transporter [Terrihabitans sp. PJ23]MDX6805418.1 DMT family transporter [Terrihabitans sp. PJ23]
MAGKAVPATRSLWVGYGLAATGAFLFSTKSIFIKLAYAEGVDPETLLALRMVMSLPFYLVIGLLGVRSDPVRSRHVLGDRRAVASAVLIGLLGYWFSSYADFKGLLYISAGFERLILFTYPLFVVLLGAMFFGQRVRVRALMAFGISYCGLAVIFVQDFAEIGTAALVGVAWVMVAAVAYALYQLLAHRMIAGMGARLFTCIAMSAACVAAILQYLLLHPIEPVSERVLWLGLLLAIAATVLPSFFMNAALSRISAQANATIATISPVATLALAVLVLGDSLTVIDVAGSTLVLAGIGFFTLMSRSRA